MMLLAYVNINLTPPVSHGTDRVGSAMYHLPFKNLPQIRIQTQLGIQI